ncbi:unnamed protein product [Litomosoides sigmodontis]|uniref:Uncharacterized protein n=1 Tax=Litomosoides sigmodontis TaxID=42156 RepID=A0A3P6UE88_LITSI|nr:unnamed protein product [Litomosoides sigmodontis]
MFVNMKWRLSVKGVKRMQIRKKLNVIVDLDGYASELARTFREECFSRGSVMHRFVCLEETPQHFLLSLTVQFLQNYFRLYGLLFLFGIDNSGGLLFGEVTEDNEIKKRLDLAELLLGILHHLQRWPAHRSEVTTSRCGQRRKES